VGGFVQHRAVRWKTLALQGSWREELKSLSAACVACVAAAAAAAAVPLQTAEYLLDKGLLDLVVPRSFLKGALFEIIDFYKVGGHTGDETCRQRNILDEMRRHVAQTDRPYRPTSVSRYALKTGHESKDLKVCVCVGGG